MFSVSSKIPFLFVLVLLVSLTFALPAVHANQVTRISNLIAPVHSTQQLASARGVIVTYTITYSGLNAGESLASAIITTDSSAPLPGGGLSVPDSCLMTGQNASCQVLPHSSSGTESMTFAVILTSTQRYNLQAVAGFVDKSGTQLIAGTVSSVDFTVNVDSNVLLTISVPNSVSSLIDGASQKPGSLTVPLQPGVHDISVPQTVQFANDTRLRFDHWMDGSTQPTRTQDLEDDLTYAAFYTTQYDLHVIDSSGTVTGGWFDQGSTAQVVAPLKTPMPGIVGLLGGTLSFNGWYENGTLIANSASYSVVMDSPQTVYIEWTADYVTAEVVIGMTLAAVAILCLIAYRRSSRRRVHP